MALLTLGELATLLQRNVLNRHRWSTHLQPWLAIRSWIEPPTTVDDDKPDSAD